MKTAHCISTNVVSPWIVAKGELVASVMMINEGVHAGNHGPIFWPSQVLRAAALKWENVPVTLNHPTNEAGEYVSINHSTAIRATAIGRITDTYFDEQRWALKATIRIPSTHPQIAKIQNIKEVSVEVFGDEIYGPGEWEGEFYLASAIACEPDYLALLTD
jgi:hypothetical protein